MPKESTRATSALLLFRKEWLAARKAKGESRVVASAATWKDVKDAFDQLSAEQRTNYDERAELSIVEAKTNRNRVALAKKLALTEFPSRPGVLAAIATAPEDHVI